MDKMLVEELPFPADPLDLYGPLRHQPHPFLLESALEHPELGRYSFLGTDPFCVLQDREGAVEAAGSVRGRWEGGIFAALSSLLPRFRLPRRPEWPPLAGGAVGYFGYDLARQLERLPQKNAAGPGLPDATVGLYDVVICLDHAERRAWLVSTGLPERGAAAKERAFRRAWQVRRLLSAPAPAPGRMRVVGTVRSNFTRQAYEAAVARVIEYIRAGDVFQVNLSQRWTARVATDPLAFYRRLRLASPAPFAALLELPEGAVISSSPERFLKVSGRRAETRPIKGTRPRGDDPAADAALRSELLSSAKDRAELLMIVDLMRNDLGKVCRYGSVRTRRLHHLEPYPGVFHLDATVTGRLSPGLGAVDLLRACFPGGSITGAPKIRAMEIIEELEPVRRGVYTGALGYLSFSGQADLAMAIRTAVQYRDQLWVQAGGGIVADSDPAAEYRETWHKAAGMLRALGVTKEEVAGLAGLS
ncbi:MAG: aminodeoxychorismate synthase component I [Thermaerobacter sp.]|jgi:para-aminobenzoate synthetase component 1|nr:aminodeoxychorismate synthase component I [Thermaerobacter sp.]